MFIGDLGQRRRDIAEWLSDVESTTPPFRATPGTGEWLLKAVDFERWERGEFRVLYCHGDRKFNIALLAIGSLTKPPQRVLGKLH